MNKTDKFFYRLAMPFPMACPKADGAIEDKVVGEVTYPGFTEIEKDSNDGPGKLNFQQGFPGVYSVPKSNGGQYVTRGQMNAIGNLASQNQFYFLAGGINTFDQAFCDAIGGYPQGAILNYLDEDRLFFVESLVDGNTNNFVVNGVDGVTWRLLVTPIDESQINRIFFQGGRNAGIGRSILGTVKAKRDGTITVSDTFKLVLSGSQYALGRFGGYGTGSWIGFTGCSLAIKDLGVTLPSSSSIKMPTYKVEDTAEASSINWEGWANISGNYAASGYWNTGSPSYNIIPMLNFNGFVEIGHYYMIAIFASSIADVVFYGSGSNSDGYDNNTAVAISASEITGEALLTYSE